MRKIKLLSIIESLGRGGAEHLLVNNLCELKKLGMDCEVITLFSDNQLAVELEKVGIVVHQIFLSNKWNIFEGIRKIRKILNSSKYDIIHAHLFFAYFYTSLVTLFNSKIKTVVTFHNLGYNTYPANTIVKKLRKKLDEFIVNKLIDKRVAISSAVKKHFNQELKCKDIDIIHNAIPIDSIKNFTFRTQFDVLSEYTKFDSNNTYLITPGRLVQEKGHIYLLKAIIELNISNPNLVFLIVGSGPKEIEIKNFIKSNQINNIILISGVEQKRLFELINSSDIVVIPSISEGFGMIVAEAMCLNKPIISTKIDGILDLINKEQALLVEPKNSTLLSKSILKLVKSPNLQKELIEHSSIRIKEFDTKFIAKKWLKYYEEMIKK
ncbi:MAG: glycosyltransferase family 4 protein [Aliarcobacter sp.]|nr:glycosyltransferase family 4 protein [Aliarcobacter sp.]